MITLEPVKWSSDPGDFRGEVGATLGLDGPRWEALGARFTPRDDGNGERPGLAVGAVETANGELSFAVLDYGEDSTYLLVPTVEERQLRTAAVLGAMRAREMIVEAEILDASIGLEAALDQPDVAERLDGIEETLLALAAASVAQRSAWIPRARVVGVLGSGRSSVSEHADWTTREVLEALKASAGRAAAAGTLTGMVRYLNDEGYVQFRPALGGHSRLIHLDENWFQIVRERLKDPPRQGEPVLVEVEILEEAESSI
jgi:hypothetical protein